MSYWIKLMIEHPGYGNEHISSDGGNELATWLDRAFPELEVKR